MTTHSVARKRYYRGSSEGVGVDSTALLEECRKAVAFLGPHTEGYSFTRLLDDALTRQLRRLSVKHRGGRPFPPRQGELKRGARAQTSKVQFQRARVTPKERVSCAPAR